MQVMNILKRIVHEN